MTTQKIKEMSFKRVFAVRYLSPTNNRGSRVVITDTHREEKIIIPYNYECTNIWEMAFIYLTEERKINIESRAFGNNEDYLITSDFLTDLKGGKA